MFFSMHNNQSYPYPLYDSYSSSSDDMYSSYSTSPTVDCTLSLGTPSTRSYSYDQHQKQQTTNQQYHLLHENNNNTNNNGSTNFCWDFIHSAKQHQFPPNNNNSHVKSSSNRGGGGNHINHHTNTNSDSLLARRCANCDTTSTPLWRNGPRGPKSLCNACGIRFKKEERRASAASTNYNGGGGVIVESSSQEISAGGHYYNNSNNHTSSRTIHHSSSHQKMPASCFSPAMANEFLFIEDNDHHHHLSESNGISFLSWRLNVSDRPGLVHDFTR